MAVIKARPTIYKGVQMRSRLEAGFAQWLDYWNMDWEYEPQCFGSERGQYLPDFLVRGVRFANTENVAFSLYIETKPDGWPFDEGDDTLDLLDRMSVIYDSVGRVTLALVQPGPSITMAWAGPNGASNPTMMSWLPVLRSDGTATMALIVPAADHETPWSGEWWNP